MRLTADNCALIGFCRCGSLTVDVSMGFAEGLMPVNVVLAEGSQHQWFEKKEYRSDINKI
jgi:hypothetical protein